MATADELKRLTEASGENLKKLVADRPVSNPVRDFGQGANTGIATLLDAPGMAVAAGLRELGIDVQGGFFREQAVRAGLAPEPGQEPETAAFATGEVVGPTALALPAAPAGAAARGAGLFSNIARDIGQSALRAPGRFAAAETAAAAGAGAGGFVAQQNFPDSDAAEFIGQVLGGLTPGAVTGATKLLFLSGPMAKTTRAVLGPLTKSGGRRRAEGRVERAVPSRADVLRELETGDVLPDILTPAQKSGERGLLELEKSVIESSTELRVQSDEQIANANAAIKESLLDLGEGEPVERTKETLKQATDYLLSLVDARMRIAAQRAEERIADLEPGRSRVAANNVAREELDRALSAARAQERDVWSNVPDEINVPLEGTRSLYERLLKERTEAGRAFGEDNLPPALGTLLGRLNKRGNLTKGRLGTETNVRELMGFEGLYSELRGQAARARAEKNFTKARFMEDLADAVLEDVTKVEGASEAVASALEYSRGLNDRFTRGPVGKILGTGKDRGLTTPENLTLEVTVGRKGPVGREAAQALESAVEFTSDSQEMRSAVVDFIRDEFMRSAVKDGKVNPGSARSFQRQFQDVLERFPELASDIRLAVETGNSASLAQSRLKAARGAAANPNKNRAAVFLNAPPGQEIKRVVTSNNPAAAADKVLRLANRDKTGAAKRGLATAFGEFLLERAQTGTTDATGNFIISGDRLLNTLSDPRVQATASRFLPRGAQDRIRTIANTAKRLEAATKAGTAPEGIIGDVPGNMTQLVARVTGAQVGRQIATATGGGTVQTPGIVAGAFQKALRAGVQDPAKDLLVAAVNNEDLFRALLRADDPAAEKFVRRQMNAWLLSITLGQEDGQ